MQTKILLASLPLCAALVACSPKTRAPEVERALVKEVQQQRVGKEVISPLVGALDDPGLPSACVRLELLTKLAGGKDSFSYFSSLERGSDKVWQGSLSLRESPFTQLFFGETFVVDSEEEFMKKAQAERDAGRLGAMKWFVVKFMNWIGAVKTVQFSATNDKLAENFPGIFGEPGPVAGSLHWRLAQRVRPTGMRDREIEKVLTSRMPMFPGSESWAEFANEQRLSLAASINAFRQGDSAKERLCGLVLYHQNFAQLLRFKGFTGPRLQGGKGTLAKLSKSQPEFPKRGQRGAFFNRDNGEPTTLENEDIKAYDPQKEFLVGAAGVPGTPAAGRPGSLSEALPLMESLIYSFEATSPASPWVTLEETDNGRSVIRRTNYLFGDVRSEDGVTELEENGVRVRDERGAILPGEMHALSLGLLTMHFKNLAYAHIRRVNAEGRSLREGERVAGLILANNGDAARPVMRLADVAHLTRVVMHLSYALKRFRDRPAADWEKLNPVYTQKTLASLLGTALFSQAELDGILNKEEQKTILLDALQTLKYPLGLLLSRLSDAGRDCVGAVQWDLVTGDRRPVAACSKADRELLADALDLIARDGQSPLFRDMAARAREGAKR